MQLLLFNIILLISGVYCCQSRWNRNTNPVLELRPVPQNGLIWFKPRTKKSVEYYKTDLNKLFESYKEKSLRSTVTECFPHKSPPQNKVCNFIISPMFAPCLPEYDYGYENGAPCIFLSLSKINNWRPVSYNSSNMPIEMPKFLQKRIMDEEQRGTHQKIWVSCEGQTPTDIENIGPMIYSPFNGFNNHYFPFTGSEDYLSPLVAVYFEKPKSGVLINVECKVWAKNIPRNPEKKLGYLQFGLLIDY